MGRAAVRRVDLGHHPRLSEADAGNVQPGRRGGDLEGGDTATTLRVRDGKTQLADGPFIRTGAFITGLDVVHCADRQQAVQLAATHPAARYAAIEVRPFEAG